MEALSALCNGQIRPKPCRHAWLGCLSECCHGDDGLLRGYGTHSFDNRQHVYLVIIQRECVSNFLLLRSQSLFNIIGLLITIG